MPITQIVAVKADGSEYNTVPPNATGSGAGGNGGSVAKASDSSLLDGVSVARYDAGVFGSTVLDNNHIDKALSGGTLAYNNPGPIAKKITSDLNGSANDVLRSGAAQPTLVQSIHKIQVEGMGYAEGVRTTKTTSAIRGGYWNIYNGQFAGGYPQSSVDVLSLAPSYQDSAANPTRAIPGRITYKTSAPVSVNTNYKKKTG
jgi:hypothetical protein